ncbi:MAG: hypothetical protein EOP81_14955 [Variovorax sp.]|nr:MAG: hypothetical protein EOP81_14955 [Variovorax sp.]
MSVIVLVHGVNQQQKGAATIHEEVIHALSDGIRNAAKDVPDAELQSKANALAERISALDIEVSTPFYGDLFLKPRVDGSAAQEFGDSLARAWIQSASERAARERTRVVAEQELRQLTAQGEAQGVGRMAGSAFESLGRIPGLAQTLMGVATAIKPTFSQLNLYLSDPVLQQTIREEVSRQISPATRVVIGHSLGSIVTFDVVRTLNQRLPLFLTLGSPLGLKEIIYKRLQPQPPSFPGPVQRWVNIADREDFVASTPDLRPLFSEGMPTGSRFDNDETVDNGNDPHGLDRYLTKKVTGLALIEALIPLL